MKVNPPNNPEVETVPLPVEMVRQIPPIVASPLASHRCMPSKTRSAIDLDFDQELSETVIEDAKGQHQLSLRLVCGSQ